MIFHTLLYMHLRAAKNALRALLVVAACTIVANAAQPSSVSTPLIQPSIVQPAGVPDERAVISLLSDVINWYRRGEVESQLVTSPAESLFLFENRQLASDIVKDAF